MLLTLKRSNQRKESSAMSTFHYYCDPSHGWLKVSRAAALELGFTKADFSRYSYIADGGTLYLEEDCDAPKFLAAYEAKHGKPKLVEHYSNSRSRIRLLRPNA
jgi:hypothetical protein